MCVCVCVCVRASVCFAHARSTVLRARTQHSACPRASTQYASLFDSTSAHISVHLHTHKSFHTHQHSCTHLTQDAAAREGAKAQTLQPLLEGKKIGAKTLSPKKKEKSQNRRKHAPAHALLLGGMRRFVSRVDSLLAASSVSCSAARC